MSQVFPRSMNSLSRISIVGGLGLVALVLTTLVFIVLSPIHTNVGIAQPQPVQFSHEHHVSGLGIDCRYCHTTVERSSFANIPPTATCINCHSQIWYTAPILEPIRSSYKNNKPMEWQRVHNVADFVYFDHSIHINKGVGCSTCHGRVDKMNLVYKEEPMTMAWCIKCHKNPTPNLRPKDQIFNMEWQPPSDPKEQSELFNKNKIHDARFMTSCSTCHH